MERKTSLSALWIGLTLILVAMTTPARSAVPEADLAKSAYGRWKELRNARPRLRQMLLEARQHHARCIQAAHRDCRTAAHSRERSRAAYLEYLRALLDAHRHAVYEAYGVGNLFKVELLQRSRQPGTVERPADVAASSKRIVAVLQRLAVVLQEVESWRARPRTPLDQTYVRAAHDVAEAARRFRTAASPEREPPEIPPLASTLARVEAFLDLTREVMRFLDLYVENRLEIYAFHIW